MDEIIRRLNEPIVNLENLPPPPVYNNGGDWSRYVPFDLDRRDTPLRDISRKAVWTLSSCKTDGFGINELLDDSPDKMWQSDGKLPHSITIEFQKKTDVCFLFLYVDFRNDETYTPVTMHVKDVGSSTLLCETERRMHFIVPHTGWLCFDLRTSCSNAKSMKPSRIFAMEFRVTANHMGGRDSHIRHMRVIGPETSRIATPKLLDSELEILDKKDVDDLNHQHLFKLPVIR